MKTNFHNKLIIIIIQCLVITKCCVRTVSDNTIDRRVNCKYIETTTVKSNEVFINPDQNYLKYNDDINRIKRGLIFLYFFTHNT